MTLAIKKPEFLRGGSPLRVELFEKQITLKSLQERIKKDHMFNVPPSTLSIILDEKLCDFVKKEAREMCKEIRSNLTSEVL